MHELKKEEYDLDRFIPISYENARLFFPWVENWHKVKDLTKLKVYTEIPHQTDLLYHDTEINKSYIYISTIQHRYPLNHFTMLDSHRQCD